MQYDRVGDLLSVDDVVAPNGSMYDGDWTYTYDGVGRLKQATSGAGGTADFTHDYLDNMTSADMGFPVTGSAVSFAHSSSKPHQVSQLTPGSLPNHYDANGSLRYRPATIQNAGLSDLEKEEIVYDEFGRVVEVHVADGTQTSATEYFHSHNGKRIAKTVDSEPTFYFDKWFEVTGSKITRHFYFGTRRVAFSTIDAPSSPLVLVASPPGTPSTMFAFFGGNETWLAAMSVADSAGAAAASSVTLLILLLCTASPGGRRRFTFFGKVSRRPVSVLSVLVSTGVVLLPFPLGSGGADPAYALCPEEDSSESKPAYFVHTNHLGSTTMLTSYKIPGEADGTVTERYRYNPFGVALATTPTGTPVPSGSELTDRLYTGQRWDASAQLYDYNARFYDPFFGRFLTIDPIRDGPNPYAYVAWNPINNLDPTGLCTGRADGNIFTVTCPKYPRP